MSTRKSILKKNTTLKSQKRVVFDFSPKKSSKKSSKKSIQNNTLIGIPIINRKITIKQSMQSMKCDDPTYLYEKLLINIEKIQTEITQLEKQRKMLNARKIENMLDPNIPVDSKIDIKIEKITKRIDKRIKKVKNMNDNGDIFIRKYQRICENAKERLQDILQKKSQGGKTRKDYKNPALQ